MELISRLAAEAHVTAQLPRQLDAILFERLVRRRDLSAPLRSRLHLTESTERLIRLIAAFLRGQFALPTVVDRVLTAPLVSAHAHSAPDSQPALFDPSDNSSLPPAAQ